ncbi:lanC-like protein 1 isoform X2 [Trichoplusia ni]|uniref:LanC-like protein 1 isoform X2 n=1 Tax=Trichoplusia ni TaxID=7111 RepID=A0A7E5X0S2_TRINI|nr:lanC-like protein 1 isoform X2 [Trichoplusia ni]
MTPKGSFENQFDDYSLDIAANIINDAKDGISEKFQTKLQNFKTMKLQLLKTKMESDIFYDSTVYTGSAGLALYYFMCSLKNDASSQESLKMALEYLDIENLKGRRISFLCGDAGPLAIATVISYKLGTKRNDKILPDYKTLAHRLMSLISLLNESPDEILYGKAGYLYALLFVNKHINGKEIIPVNHIEKVINSILKSGKQYSAQMKSDSPLLWHWHDKVYFGAAHGMAGILYMLLQIFEEEKYMKVALQCGDLIWQRGLCTKGYSICHGVSGNAYAFIQLFQATKRPLYLYRACCFMEWCAVERPGTELHRPDRPASLFEGLSGRLYLAEDITRIAEARFPAFGL